jgi:hypothetical protein
MLVIKIREIDGTVIENARNERTKLTREFIALTNIKKQQEAELKKTKDRLRVLEQGLLEIYKQDQNPGDKVDGYTAYVVRQIYVSGTDNPELHTKLTEYGYGSFVKPTVSPQQIKSLLRDLDESGDDGDKDARAQYDELATLCNVYEAYSIGIKAGSISNAARKFTGNGDA